MSQFIELGTVGFVNADKVLTVTRTRQWMISSLPPSYILTVTCEGAQEMKFSYDTEKERDDAYNALLGRLVG